MPEDNNLLSLDNALSLMNSAPAKEATADWKPDADAPAQELPPEKDAVAAPAADETAEQTNDAPAADAEGDKDTPSSDDEGKTKDDGTDPGAALPIIEPPSSWKTEEKDVFKSLPRAAQEAIKRREQDTTTELRNLQNAAAERAKTVDGEVARIKGLADQMSTVVNDRVNDLVREFPEIKTQADVEALAAKDPARFGLFQAKLMRFNAAQTAQAEAQRELDTRNEQQHQTFLASAHEKLVEAFPTWKDVSLGRKEMTELQDYAIKLGASEQGARNTLDPIVYKLTQKAMLYDRAQAAKVSAIDRTPPKVIKPGTSPSKADQRNDARSAQLRKLEKSGDLEDALDLLRA